MQIEEKKLRHWIDNFYGYGSWNARIWFIAYEEAGGDVPEDVADKINYFYGVQRSETEETLCDIRELYGHVRLRLQGPKGDLFTNRYEYRFDDHAVLHGVWKNLIAFTHGYTGTTVPDLLTYQRNTFTSPTARREALIPLYPLPSPHNHAWYYSWLELPQLSFLKSRTSYEEHVFPGRIHRILENIIRYKPEVVLMYGMNNINTLKKSVQDFFDGVKFKMIKATKREIPQHHRTDFQGTTMLITTQIPALRHNRIETGFDWEGFGRSVNRQ